MLPYLPLLIEIALLAATAYLYWLTRQLLTRYQADSESEIANQNQVEKMQGVAALLNEWQAAASAAHEEFHRQQVSLQATRQQTEKTIAELRGLIAQSETSKESLARQEMSSSVRYGANLSMESDHALPPAVCPSEEREILPSLPAAMAEAVLAFSDHLRENNYSQVTIIRTASRAQHFVAWLEERGSARVPLRPINSDEIKDYGSYITVQPDQAGFNLERELVAIKIFAAWINELCDCQQPPDGVELNRSVPVLPSPTQSTGSAVPLAQGADRYRSVFILADQGVDSAAITAQTGLEREAVRLLLSMGPSSPMRKSARQNAF
ncbi:MAG: hypothetical protein KJ077_03190 [Anaerolineae bacterium]|nr:hypothetical protein [Anaerolineae bacterium]